MIKILGNTAVFIILYLLFMVPTYLLPYLGSNSAALNAAGAGLLGELSPQFFYHLGALLVLVVVTWFRGVNISKVWLVIFPIVAGLFDLVPGLSVIPFVPTVMHLLAIIIGASGNSAVAIKNTENS